MKAAILLLFSSLMFSISIHAQCFEDRHSQSILDSWASCEVAESPHPNLPESHWIMYDFSEVYRLGSSHIWNFNYPGESGTGLNEVLISYSSNGTDWLEAGEFTIAQAPDTGFYEGEEGPDLNGVEARYLLLTALSNHGGDCVGISEFKVEVLGIVSSTEDELLNIGLSVSPNPCSEFFTFDIVSNDISNLSYQVSNSLGELITVGKVGSFNTQIDTKLWAEGNYILSINDGNKVRSEKITVIR